MIGKANMDEFAMGSGNIDSFYGPARNAWTPPHSLDGDFYVAGGSSGGCAVAVSKEFADVYVYYEKEQVACRFCRALGSDTGGSARNPASFNGVYAFKPSYGILSRYGLVALVNSFDAPSLFTRTVEECEHYFGQHQKSCFT